MRDSWLKLVDSVLRPARPELERCLREGERHLAAEQLFATERARAIANCEARIESARAAVFAEDDGVVSGLMTDLEREWRKLSRSDKGSGLMDLWAQVAPASWIDRKRWRDSDPAEQLDAAIALAADASGVEAAERAIDSLRAAFAAWGIPVGSRIRWRWFEQDSDQAAELLSEPLCEAQAALAARGLESVVAERARHLEQAVHEAACARFPERALLSGGLARAAFFDCVWHAAALSARPNPVAALRELWQAGYVLSAIDASGVSVEIPPLALTTLR